MNNLLEYDAFAKQPGAEQFVDLAKNIDDILAKFKIVAKFGLARRSLAMLVSSDGVSPKLTDYVAKQCKADKLTGLQTVYAILAKHGINCTLSKRYVKINERTDNQPS